VIHPLIVGRTNVGAKDTGLAVVEAIRRKAAPDFDACVTSGLSSAEGLIEAVRDEDGDNPGAGDKRLLVKETEFRSVLTRARREGNTLGTVLRQAWDGEPLRTLTRKANRLTATDAHVVLIGHITPREFQDTLRPGDLSGGSINRLLIALSRRRPNVQTRFGNIPDSVLDVAAEVFYAAAAHASVCDEIGFTDEFWQRWENVYPELVRERPDSDAVDATARAVPQVLRLALIYALFDGAAKIDTEHLNAALALWSYCEDSARWLFSSFQKEAYDTGLEKLAAFIKAGGEDGRTRTEISRDHFKGNKTAEHINAKLAPLIHDGIIAEVDRRFVHYNEMTNFTKTASQQAYPSTNCERNGTKGDHAASSEIIVSANTNVTTDQGSSSNSFIRKDNGGPSRGRACSEDGCDEIAEVHGRCRSCNSLYVASRKAIMDRTVH
jgi:Protein of unknown function (DUF3987)